MRFYRGSRGWLGGVLLATACLPQARLQGPPPSLSDAPVAAAKPAVVAAPPAATAAAAAPIAAAVAAPETSMSPLPSGLREDWFEYLVSQTPAPRALRRVARGFNRGAANYRLGKYEIASRQLKNALSSTKINVATYLSAAAAEACVLLGKIALLQSVAQANSGLQDEAERWFCLAQRLEPQQSEAALLLQLLHAPHLL